MPDNLNIRNFKIISLTEGNPGPPLGVHNFCPAFQLVRVDGSVQNWVVSREGDRIYRLSVGGYNRTGELVLERTEAEGEGEEHPERGRPVIAAAGGFGGVDMAWEIIYHANQDAYTIRVAGTNDGWTVPTDPDAHSAIEIAPITRTDARPPQFSWRQLFRFVEPEVPE